MPRTGRCRSGSSQPGSRCSPIPAEYYRSSNLELAGRIAVALILEELVGDAHFHVVGFAGEQQQRFVLRLPTEPRDRAVISVVIETSGNASARFCCALAASAASACHQRRSPPILIEDRGRDPKYDVIASELGRKIRLSDVAAGRIGTPGDHKTDYARRHPVIHRRLRTKRASRTGPLAVTNGGTNVLRAHQGRDRYLWICGRTRASDRRLEWHPEQLSRLNLGPRPSGPASTSWKTSFATSKY